MATGTESQQRDDAQQSEDTCTKESCSGCPSAGNCSQEAGKIPKEKLGEGSSVKHVIGIISGKGGVGKSLVTGLLAVAAQKAGSKVGILDADVTGPSIPRMFGLKFGLMNSPLGIIPARTEGGIKVMSTNLLLKDDTDPVIWRGPIIAGAIKQFWSEVVWGQVDYMFVDMPPGTGDVALTVFQSLPVDGIIIVTSPQELVSMIVQKAVKMAEEMDVPVLGLVENMSYFKCPDCGHEVSIFGESHADEIAKEHGIETIAKIPIDPSFAAATDAGKAETLDVPSLAPIVKMLQAM